MLNFGLQSILRSEPEFSIHRNFVSFSPSASSATQETQRKIAFEERKFISNEDARSEKTTTTDKSANSISSAGTSHLHAKFDKTHANLLEDITQKYYSELRNTLKACIMTSKPSVTFNDIAGNYYAKEVIKETFILPKLLPNKFKNGKLKPWNSILLYGPPGTGKTMLAQAVCSHIEATCFWVSLADITSKFIGESEKLLRMLFEVAKEHSPAIILIDEMDSLGRKRNGSESETERRIKTEFLRQMDGIHSTKDQVSVLATTNMPWELDIAALRRFQRKILIPMPSKEVRAEIIKLHAGENHALIIEDFERLSELTEGYSGSDLSTLVNEALMRPVKELQHATHFKKIRNPEKEHEQDAEYLWTACSPDDSEAERKDLSQIEDTLLYIRKPNFEDFKKSIGNCKPTVHVSFIELYMKFLAKYGHDDQKKQMMDEEGPMKPKFVSYYS